MTVISLLFGAGSGALVALLLKFPFAEPMNASFYEVAGYWNVPYDDEVRGEGRGVGEGMPAVLSAL